MRKARRTRGYNDRGTIQNTYATGTVTGKNYVGGLVGASGASGSENTCQIINSYANCTVQGKTAGSLVGFNDKNITDCFGTGSVSGEFVTGGLVGRNNQYGNVKNSYTDSSVEGKQYVGMLFGKNAGTFNTVACAAGIPIGNSKDTVVSNEIPVFTDSETYVTGVLKSWDETIWDTKEGMPELLNAVEVPDKPEPATLESISVTAPTKVEYTVGEKLELAGMKVIANYSDDTTMDIAIEDCEVSGYDAKMVGGQTVTVTYEGKTDTFKVTVKEAATPEIPEGWTLLADFSFNGEPAEGEGFTGGEAEAKGTYTLVDHEGNGKALKLNGTDQFLTVTKEDGSSLLTGMDEVEVSFQMNPSTSATNWGFFAAPNTNEQKYQQEHYIGVVNISGTVNAERYNNSGARPAVAYYETGENAWMDVKVSYLKDKTVLYINGEQVAEAASGYSLADILGENSVLYIGYSTWKTGEYATAEIDNYRIIGRTFTEEEIKADLKAAIDKEVGKEADYTPSSWKNYEDALADAQAVYDDENATRAEVNAAEAALTKAQNALTKKADKTALDAAIKAAVSLDDKDKYEATSWAAYEKALAEAKEVYADEEATQTKVNSATKALTDAQNALKEIEEPNPVVIESITVTAPTKTEYTAGEELDLDGMKVTANYSDGTTKDIAAADCEVSGYDTTKAGEQTVTVTYEGKTATFKVTVKEAEKPNETDKTALEAAVKAVVPDTEKGKYTEESWAAYEEALNQAKEVLADTDATQKEIDDAAAALDKAAEALESKGLPYVDVVKDDWFYNAAYYNYFAGTMTGTDPTHFSPYATLVRAQFATILHRMEGKPDAEYTNRFPDVPDGQFYSTAVLWAADAKVVTGYTDSGYFGTNDPITREQMVVMMYRYADYKNYDISKTADLSSFSDAEQVSGFAETAMKWAVENGIIEGKENTDNSYRLDPQGSTSRAECAIIIQRFMETFDK